MIAADISIARIRFLVRRSLDLDLEPLHSSYDLFRSSPESPPVLKQFQIYLRKGSAPSFGEEKPVFQLPPAYTMSKINGDRYLFRRHEPIPGGFTWTACIDSDFREATVYCEHSAENSKEICPMMINPLFDTFDRYALIYCLGRNSGAFFHAAGIDVGGNGLLFPGISGAGKSTISSLMLQHGESKVLCDERIAMRTIDNEIHIFGTPWVGEVGIAENRSVPLRAICFLRHASENKLEPLSPLGALSKLLTVVTIPWSDTDLMEQILAFLEQLMKRIPLFILHFTPDKGSVDLAKTLVV